MAGQYTEVEMTVQGDLLSRFRSGTPSRDMAPLMHADCATIFGCPVGLEAAAEHACLQVSASNRWAK
jgi:hypothetical protein